MKIDRILPTDSLYTIECKNVILRYYLGQNFASNFSFDGYDIPM